jgi:hypothetical protein
MPKRVQHSRCHVHIGFVVILVKAAPGSSGCPATRCEQSWPYHPTWHLQKPMLHSPCPLHWLTHTASCTYATHATRHYKLMLLGLSCSLRDAWERPPGMVAQACHRMDKCLMLGSASNSVICACLVIAGKTCPDAAGGLAQHLLIHRKGWLATATCSFAVPLREECTHQLAEGAAKAIQVTGAPVGRLLSIAPPLLAQYHAVLHAPPAILLPVLTCQGQHAVSRLLQQRQQ